MKKSFNFIKNYVILLNELNDESFLHFLMIKLIIEIFSFY